MFNTLKYYKFWFTVSGIILVFGALSLSIYGLKLGIDFKGGDLTELQFNKPFDFSAAQNTIAKEGIGNFQLQPAGNNSLIIRTTAIGNDKRTQMEQDLKKNVGDFTETQTTEIGPVIGKQLTGDAIKELIIVSVGIIIYIAYAFRRVQKPVSSWQFGSAALVALFHDLLFVLGVFSILGHFKGVEIDSLFVTAMLTVLGFSVHDTIVVFDRIRENLKIYGGQSIDFVINYSIEQTIARSLNTSLTVLFVLLALLLFGGATIQWFVFALFIGIIVGTYSSIFIASPVLMLWQRRKMKKA